MAAPPTLIDADGQTPLQPHRPGRRSRFPLALTMVLALLVVVGGGAFAAYWFVLRYEPVAHRHVPTGSSLAVRIDFQEIALFGPVRRHLWPLVFEREANAQATAAPSSFADRIEAATGLKLSRDIREILLVNYGRTDSGQWFAVLGGKIPSGVVRGLAVELAGKEETTAWEHLLPEDILVWRTLGVAIGQAKDRSLIVASDRKTLALALPEQDGARAMGLPESGAFTFAVAASAWNEWGSGMAATFLPGLRSLAKLHGCNGRFALGSSPELSMQCRLASDVDANQVRSSLLGLVTVARGMTTLAGGADVLGERKALADLQIDALPDGRIMVTAPWPTAGLERGAEALATKVRAIEMLRGKP